MKWNGQQWSDWLLSQASFGVVLEPWVAVSSKNEVRRVTSRKAALLSMSHWGVQGGWPLPALKWLFWHPLPSLVVLLPCVTRGSLPFHIQQPVPTIQWSSRESCFLSARSPPHTLPAPLLPPPPSSQSSLGAPPWVRLPAPGRATKQKNRNWQAQKGRKTTKIGVPLSTNHGLLQE